MKTLRTIDDFSQELYTYLMEHNPLTEEFNDILLDSQRIIQHPNTPIRFSQFTKFVGPAIRWVQRYPLNGTSKRAIVINTMGLIKCRNVVTEDQSPAQYFIDYQLSDLIDEIIICTQAKQFAKRGLMACLGK